MSEDLLKEFNLDNEKYLVVGVSTGPDSMALLHYLITHTKKKLVIAHINHNVRKQSIEEAKYLEEYCKNNNLIFEYHKINSYKEKNFENEARTKRYKFYEEILHKYNSHYLFLAHHGDDLIETILMKIIRGSNLEGYAGIKKISKIKDYYIIRPLLNYTKNDLIKYNNNHNIKYYIDETNKDTKYTRNRFRKNILPLLKKEDKDVHKKFIKYSNTLLEYNNYLNYEVSNIINNIYINNKIYINKLKSLHPFLQKNILYKILSKTYNNEQNIIKEEHIEGILKLINTPKPNIYINLPNNIIAKKEYDNIYLIQKKDNNTNYKIELNDYQKIDNYIIKKIDKTENNGNNICRLNSQNLKLPLYIRSKKDGDYIEVLGLNGKKKVKEIFIENKIPVSKRNIYPILVDADDNILWLPNLKKSKFNLKKDENYDIIIEYCEEEENYE